MTYLLFVTITSLIGISGSILFVKHNHWKVGRTLLPPLAILLFAAGIAEYLASLDHSAAFKALWIRLSLIFQLLSSFLLLELTFSFLGQDVVTLPPSRLFRSLRLHYIWRITLPLSIAAAMLLPWFSFSSIDSEIKVSLTGFGQGLFITLFCYHLLTLYILEKIFRLTSTVQKRFFSQFLFSTAAIALGSMILLARMLFYNSIDFLIIQLHAALCGIFFPGLLYGLTRYRLWQEHIAIGRGIVYTSFTLLFFGIFLVVLGILASVIRFTGIDFDEFEEFVILFFLLFIAIIVFFSPQMRKTITALTRKYVYKSKYDYRDQLLRLHKAHQTPGSVTQTIKLFIDNLQFTIVTKNAYVFIRSANENNFSLISADNVTAPSGSVTLRANAPLIQMFEHHDLSALNLHQELPAQLASTIESEKLTLDKMNISHLFAIRYDSLLLGILCIDSGNHSFDSEDLMIITMFCESIGTALYRDKIHTEHVEQKQFESFNHMASFILHDIKNQVATLSLVTKNAKANIADTEFHPILLRSLENCSTNLSLLIEKLKAPPRKDALIRTMVDCNEVISLVVNQSRDTVPNGISLTLHTEKLPLVNIDRQALIFILKNLIINAIEAIDQKGLISCSTGVLEQFVRDDTYHFCLTPGDRENRTVYLMIEDNGKGMSRTFIENSLFKPFSTTKDKGVGIGLYQCKTLIESMDGKLLCWSDEGKGTRFIILF